MLLLLLLLLLVLLLHTRGEKAIGSTAIITEEARIKPSGRQYGTDDAGGDQENPPTHRAHMANWKALISREYRGAKRTESIFVA